MKWIDASIKRPKVRDKIITESAVGLFMGVYESTINGMVAVEGKQFDKIHWDDIYRWIPYPKD